MHRVLHVAQQLSATSELRVILSVIIDAMRDVLSAERATVFEHDTSAAELFTTVAHGLVGGEVGTEIRIPVGTGIAGECARTLEKINIPDAHADPRFNPEVDRRTGFRTRSLLTLPLVGADGELIGVAQILNKQGGPFDAIDEEIAAALASQAAVAIRRGRLMRDALVKQKLERDIALARQIQQSSFPRSLPALTGFELEAWSEPADETGGDSFDVISLRAEETGSIERARLADDGRIMFLMADAAGHGIGPALAVAQLRSMLRMGTRMDADIEELALHINQQLWQDLPPGRFITAWLGQLDVERRVLTSFSAGQAPLIRYVAADDRFEIMAADTLPFGIAEEIPITVEREFSMNPGDMFCVMSDGFFEASDAAGTEFGVGRVRTILQEGRHETPAEIGQRLRSALATFTGGALADDDRTLILIKGT